MQYLLTKEELDNLVEREMYEGEIKARDAALAWVFNKLKIPQCGHTYCGSCPLSSHGNPNLEQPSFEISHIICKKRRTYSK